MFSSSSTSRSTGHRPPLDQDLIPSRSDSFPSPSPAKGEGARQQINAIRYQRSGVSKSRSVAHRTPKRWPRSARPPALFASGTSRPKRTNLPLPYPARVADCLPRGPEAGRYRVPGRHRSPLGDGARHGRKPRLRLPARGLVPCCLRPLGPALRSRPGQRYARTPYHPRPRRTLAQRQQPVPHPPLPGPSRRSAALTSSPAVRRGILPRFFSPVVRQSDGKIALLCGQAAPWSSNGSLLLPYFSRLTLLRRDRPRPGRRGGRRRVRPPSLSAPFFRTVLAPEAVGGRWPG